MGSSAWVIANTTIYSSPTASCFPRSTWGRMASRYVWLTWRPCECSQRDVVAAFILSEKQHVVRIHYLPSYNIQIGVWADCLGCLRSLPLSLATCLSINSPGSVRFPMIQARVDIARCHSIYSNNKILCPNVLCILQVRIKNIAQEAVLLCLAWACTQPNIQYAHEPPRCACQREVYPVFDFDFLYISSRCFNFIPAWLRPLEVKSPVAILAHASKEMLKLIMVLSSKRQYIPEIIL